MELSTKKHYTYEDYLKWDDDVRREVINGEVYAMASPYWIVNPNERTVMVCLLENGSYKVIGYEETDTITVNVLENCEVKLSEIFE